VIPGGIINLADVAVAVGLISLIVALAIRSARPAAIQLSAPGNRRIN